VTTTAKSRANVSANPLVTDGLSTNQEGLPMSIDQFSVTTGTGENQTLQQFAGKVLLIVNVASKCGLTPQYKGLESLYRSGKDRGLEVLAFPCNQFGGQEPGTDEEIGDFCSTQYDVTFPVFGKIDVNGPSADPLFVYLRTEAPGNFGPSSGALYDHVKTSRPEMLGTNEVKWNFTKFLIGRNGQVLRRYEPSVTPEEIQPDIEALLG
jgi:glutathione peroxidase